MSESEKLPDAPGDGTLPTGIDNVSPAFVQPRHEDDDGDALVMGGGDDMLVSSHGSSGPFSSWVAHVSLAGLDLDGEESEGRDDDEQERLVPGSSTDLDLSDEAMTFGKEGTLKARRPVKDVSDSPVLGECRICHEEDTVGNLDIPCSCAGTLKYAHEECLQHWCNEKKSSLCEICHKPYKPNYIIPENPPPEQSASSVLSIEIREEAGPDGTPSRVLTLRDAVTGEETRFDLSEAEEPQDPWACCKMLVLVVFILMFLPRALMLLVDMEDEAGDVPAAVLLRLVGVFLPMLLLVRVITLLNDRRRELEASQSEAAEAAAQVAFLLHARHAQFFARSHADINPSHTSRALGALTPPVAQGVV